MLHVMKNVLAYGLVFGLGTAGVIWARVAALRPDPEAERVLNSPGVIEKALARARENAAATRQDKPPLVAAAEALALYLNPPAPPTAKRPVPRQHAAPELKSNIKKQRAKPQIKIQKVAHHVASHLSHITCAALIYPSTLLLIYSFTLLPICWPPFGLVFCLTARTGLV